MDLTWKGAAAAIGKSIGYHCMLMAKHGLSLYVATSFINSILGPKIEHDGRHGQFTQAQLDQWDSLTRALSALVGSAARQIKAELLVGVLDLRLPSHIIALAQISETFLQLNDDGIAADSARGR